MKKETQDFIDLQRELSGLSEGKKAPRFTDNWGRTHLEEQKKNEFLSLWQDWALLSCLEMAKLLQEQIARALKAVEGALRIAKQNARLAADETDKVLSRAVELPDGTKVFKTREGSEAYREDGDKLTEEEIASVQWTDDNPTWEEKQNAEELEQQARDAVNDIEEYKKTLEDHDKRLKSGEPLSDEEMDEMRAAITDMPDSVNFQQSPQKSSLTKSEIPNGISITDTFMASALNEVQETMSLIPTPKCPSWTP